ncbi:MAG TPA: hypothetical protein VHU89_17420 [Acidobacteriaceae bacterium]|jgi:hypothetical protein|nr:hypothetical protein [Acidobacteriaceae bacterium]
MPIRHFALSAAIAAALSVTAYAQQAPAGFHTVYCVKVKPGMDAEFHAATSGDLLKLARHDVSSGMFSAWYMLATIVPSGTEAQCDYAFVEFYPGLPPAPMSDAEQTADLHKAGIDKTDQQFISELEASGTLVSTSIVRTALQVGGAKEGDYLVVNDMHVSGSVGAWVANETKLWKPLFEDGVKDGSVDGWSVNVQFMPRGAKDRDITYTVDIYPSWQSVFDFFGHNFEERWKKVNPDVPIADGMAQEEKVDTIERTVLYQIVTAVQSK